MNTGSGVNPQVKHSITIHESYHYHLCTSTPFGLFQRLLGIIQRSLKLDHEQRARCSTALEKSIYNSWNTHEGVATACELSAFVLMNRGEISHEYVSMLPDEYLQAIEHLGFIEKLEGLPIIVAMSICEAVGYVCLATRILADFAGQAPAALSELDSYLHENQNNPDKRLKIIGDYFQDQHSLEKLNDEVKAFLEQEMHKLETKSFADFFRRISVNQRLDFMQGAKAVAIEFLRKTVPFFVEDDSQESLERLHDKFAISLGEELECSELISAIRNKPVVTNHSGRYRFFLDSLEFQNRQPEGLESKRRVANEDHLRDLLRTASQGGKKPLVHLFSIYSRSEHPKTDSSDSLHAGVSLAVYESVEKEQSSKDTSSCKTGLGVRCIYELDCIAMSDLLSFLAQVSVRVIVDLGLWKDLARLDFLQDSKSTALDNVMIGLDDSTTETWTNLIEACLKDNPFFVYHDAWDPAHRDYRDLCIVVSSDGTRFAMRPASVLTACWITQKFKKTTVVETWHDFESMLGRDWITAAEAYISYVC